jgi:FemAB-related protein (PEP-CTERM system-associated)
MMGVRLYREDDRARWDNYVQAKRDASCYHLVGWKDVIDKTFKHNTYYLLYEDDQNEVDGILPLVHLKSFFFGSFLVSLPYFNYGGACCDHKDARDALLQEAVQIATHAGCVHIELRHAYPIDKDFQEKTTKVSMRLDLPDDPEDLWKGFASKLRSQIRRPEKTGMYAKLGREEQLDAFHDVFSTNMRDLGTPVYSKQFFGNILETFPDKSSICTVFTKEGKPVASGFLVGFKGKLEIPWASSVRQFNRFSPNMLLYWSVLKRACEEGYQVFDFGRSTRDESTYRFKEQWGAKPVQLYWHYWLKNGGAPPELNPNNPKFKMAIEVWKRLPVAVTKVIGPRIVKNLP